MQCRCSVCSDFPGGFVLRSRWTYARHSIRDAIRDGSGPDGSAQQTQLPDEDSESGVDEVKLAYEDDDEGPAADREVHAPTRTGDAAPRIKDPLDGINMDSWDDPIHEGFEDSATLGIDACLCVHMS